jgi:hypothetical protein
MSAAISRLLGAEAYDLIYPLCLATLSEVQQETMQRSMANSSRVWIGSNDTDILCFWGLIPPTLLSDRAYLWLYTTEHMQAHQFVFIRHSQRMVEEMLQEFPLIVGHCAVGARKSIRWVRWLGGVFGEPQGKLLPFEIKAKT